MDCGHDSCGACCGGSCMGCGGALELTGQELELLRRFAELPFLPVVRRWDSETPVWLEEEGGDAAAFSAAITGLAQKRLIRLDYDMPLLHFDYAGYERYPCQGSMALTARGQAVLEVLAIQGITE